MKAQLWPGFLYFSSIPDKNIISYQFTTQPQQSLEAYHYYIKTKPDDVASGWVEPIFRLEEVGIEDSLPQDLLTVDSSILSSEEKGLPSTAFKYQQRAAFGNANIQKSILEYLRQLQHDNNLVIEEQPLIDLFVQSKATNKINSIDANKNENFLNTGDNKISNPVNIPIDLTFDAQVNLDNNQHNKSNEYIRMYMNNFLENLHDLNDNNKKELETAGQTPSFRLDDYNKLDFSAGFNSIFNKDRNDNVVLGNDVTEQQEKQHSTTRYGDGEYIDHPLALVGHQYVQGGAGEGRQLLGPDGTFENVQVIKTDDAVPSYCEPPNPCPVGYTADNGCLEKFVNSASFSREYQAKQKCSCDNEHSLFNCAAPSLKNDDITSINNVIGRVNYHGQASLMNNKRRHQRR